MKALVGAFNQEKALVGAFSVIVQPVVEPMDRFTALVQDPAAGPSWTPGNQQLYHGHQLYSSSGSASSDQNTSSTDYSLAPLRSVQGLFCTKYELFVIVNEHKTLNISKIHTLNMFQQKAGMFP